MTTQRRREKSPKGTRTKKGRKAADDRYIVYGMVIVLAIVIVALIIKMKTKSKNSIQTVTGKEEILEIPELIDAAVMVRKEPIKVSSPAYKDIIRKGQMKFEMSSDNLEIADLLANARTMMPSANSANSMRPDAIPSMISRMVSLDRNYSLVMAGSFHDNGLLKQNTLPNGSHAIRSALNEVFMETELARKSYKELYNVLLEILCNQSPTGSITQTEEHVKKLMSTLLFSEDDKKLLDNKMNLLLSETVLEEIILAVEAKLRKLPLAREFSSNVKADVETLENYFNSLGMSEIPMTFASSTAPDQLVADNLKKLLSSVPSDILYEGSLNRFSLASLEPATIDSEKVSYKKSPYKDDLFVNGLKTLSKDEQSVIGPKIFNQQNSLLDDILPIVATSKSQGGIMSSEISAEGLARADRFLSRLFTQKSLDVWDMCLEKSESGKVENPLLQSANLSGIAGSFVSVFDTADLNSKDGTIHLRNVTDASGDFSVEKLKSVSSRFTQFKQTLLKSIFAKQKGQKVSPFEDNALLEEFLSLLKQGKGEEGFFASYNSYANPFMEREHGRIVLYYLLACMDLEVRGYSVSKEDFEVLEKEMDLFVKYLYFASSNHLDDFMASEQYYHGGLKTISRDARLFSEAKGPLSQTIRWRTVDISL